MYFTVIYFPILLLISYDIVSTIFYYLIAGFADWKEHGAKGLRPQMMKFFLTVQVSCSFAYLAGIYCVL